MYSFTASRPSNIALVKYRGKKPNQQQIPQNPSVSLTLQNCRTHMTLTAKDVTKNDSNEMTVNLVFENKQHHPFGDKIHRYLKWLQSDFPFLIAKDITIESNNTFPHSSGIASSASAFACLADLIIQRHNHLYPDSPKSLQDMSHIARLGSWSACRSVFEWLVTRWDTSNLYASPIAKTNIHPNFATIYDSVVIVSQEEKETSSRIWHSLMDNHPYAQVRYTQATNNTQKILTAFTQWDRATRGHIVEQEALELHAMMFTSDPHTILRQPDTLRIIHLVREYRNKTWADIYYTIDAWCNVHILSRQQLAQELTKDFLDQIWCDIIFDKCELLLSS